MQHDILTRPHAHGKRESPKKDCWHGWHGVYL